MSRLQDKVALITGGARGIGLGIARAFAAEGARVTLTDIREDEGRRHAAGIGGSARYLHLDVREEQDWRAAVADVVRAEGRLDILVNNAGITGFEESAEAQDPEHGSLEGWRRVHRTNQDGVFLGCREAIRAMRQRAEGSIINIGS